MPVSTNTPKPRGKSLGNSAGSELKSRTPEEVNIEIMALRKELLQAKEEANLLKCRMRKMEEEHAKKIKQLEKNLATVKKESNENEKKRESSAESVSMLRQKCQKLEQALKEQELAMKKLQNSSRPTRPTELKGLVIAYSPNNSNTRKSLTDTKDSTKMSGTPRPPGPSPAIANELSRLKESTRKLQTENTRLQQQMKEKNDEIKQLKQQALRSRTSKPSLSGSSSAPSALGRRSVPASLPKASPHSSELKQQRQSHSAVHRTTTARQSSSVNTATTVQTTKTTKIVERNSTSSRQAQVSLTKQISTRSSQSPKTAKSVLNGSKTIVLKTATTNGKEQKNVSMVGLKTPEVKPVPTSSQTPSESEAAPVPPINGSHPLEHDISPEPLDNAMDTRITELQQNVAAKKIQRTWRGHHQKAVREQAELFLDNGPVIEAANVEEMEIEEDVELLQSVLRGHQERLQYVAMQEDGGNSSDADLKQALNMVQTAHKHIWNQHVPQEE